MKRQSIFGDQANGLTRRTALRRLASLAGFSALPAPLAAWAQQQPPQLSPQEERRQAVEAAPERQLSPQELQALRIIFSDFEQTTVVPGTAAYLGYHDLERKGLPREQLVAELAQRIFLDISSAPLDLSWPADGRAPDYRHFGFGGSSARFEVDHVALSRAAARNSFNPVGDPVLFALRGAELHSQRDGAILVSERPPSHAEAHCVIGIWRRSTKTVVAWPGSTIPSAIHTLGQQRVKSAMRVSHMIPTGLHLVEVGPHRADTPLPEPGAFLFKSQVIPLRSFDRAGAGESYTVTDYWDFGMEGRMTAIQTADLDATPYRGQHYSSAGGATLRGQYLRQGAPKPTGDFAAFRKAAELFEQPPVKRDGFSTPEDGRSFFFMLLTGRDLRLAVQRQQESQGLRRLRVGSTGANVRKLQQKLRLTVDGAFGYETQKALLTDQLEATGSADGILTPGYAKAWFNLEI